MTTMKPSTKEKLKRNLNTFSREDHDQSGEKVHMRLYSLGSPDSIMKLPLPTYTKNAYQDVNGGGVMTNTQSQMQTPLPSQDQSKM